MTARIAFSLVSLSVLFGCSSGKTITARFDDARGLERGAKLIVAGIEVGSVKSISVVDGKAQVVMELSGDNSVALHRGACARVISHNGNRAVNLLPGDNGELDEDVVPECQATLVDQLVDFGQRTATMAADVASETAYEAGRRLTKTAAEFSAGLNDGSDELRQTGSNLTMAARALEEGIEEAAQAR